MAAKKPLLAWLKQCCHRLRSTTRVGSRLLTPAVWWFHTQFAGPRLILSEPQEPEPKPSCHPSHPFTFIIYHHLSGHRPYQAVLKWVVSRHWVATDCRFDKLRPSWSERCRSWRFHPSCSSACCWATTCDNHRNHGVDPGEHSCFIIFIRAKTW